MLDVVFLAMFAVVPVLGWSIYLVKYRRQYALHKQIQLALGAVLLVAVAAFEVDMRFFTDWEARAAESRIYQAGTWDGVWLSLSVHLACAVPTLLLWVYVVIAALRFFPRPAAPSAHSRQHVRVAKLASLGMLLTAITGWVFYLLAFVA
jgi:hypothetical protein